MSWKVERVLAAVLTACLVAAGSGLVVELLRLGNHPGPRAAPPAHRDRTPSPAPSDDAELQPRNAAECAFKPAHAFAPDTEDYPNVRAQIAGIANRVAVLRELEYDHDVTPTFQDAGDMATELTQKFLKSYTAAKADEDKRILVALGAVPPATNLRHVAAEGLGGDVLGYYVPKTGKLLVQRSGVDSDLGPGEKFILSHELEHALADQTLGLPRSEKAPPSKADALAAGQALAEGDATVTMLQYASTSLTEEERLSLATDPALTGSSSLDDAPYFVRKTFAFPYDAGANFVCALYLDGGWAAVDRAYEDPPESSAQVLFPQRYLDGDEPANPRDPKVPSGKWNAHPIESLGAADLLWLLQAPGGRTERALDDPQGRVAAWAGGEAHLFTAGPRSAVAMDLVARRDSAGLCESIDAWYRVSFPIDRVFKRGPRERFALASKRQAAVLRCDRGQVRLGIAPTLPGARALTH